MSKRAAVVADILSSVEAELIDFEQDLEVRHLDYVGLTWLTRTAKQAEATQAAANDNTAAVDAVIDAFFDEVVRQHQAHWHCKGQGTLRLGLK